MVAAGTVTAVAVAVAVFIDGGFETTSRALFAATAGAAVLLAVAADPDRALAAARSPPVLALAAIAVATAASAAWSVGDPARALRWSIVIAGYGAVVVAAATVAAHRGGIRVLAATIGVTAVVAAAVGLAGVAFRWSPVALHLGGEWQAAGPFEYPPALAWLVIAAMPILLSAMVRGRRAFGTVAAAGLSIAAMAAFLSSTRLAVALVVLTVGLTLAAAGPFGATRRGLACAWAVGAGLPVAVLVGTDIADPASAIAGGGWRALLLGITVAGSAAIWAWVGAAVTERRPSASVSPRGPIIWLAAGAVLVALAFAAVESTERRGPGVESSGGLLHGRVDHWEAAARTFGANPVLGVGGEAYFRGSKEEQGDDPVLYAHDLPLELAAELGLVGLVAGLAVYLGTAAAAWRSRGTLLLWLFGPAAVLFLLVNLVDWSWHLAGAGAVWAVALGGLLAGPD